MLYQLALLNIMCHVAIAFIETFYPWTKAEEQNARKVAVSRNILNSMLKRDLLLMRRVYL